MKTAKLSPPWWEYYHKLYALFGQDPEIHMNFEDDDKVIKMYVDNPAKAEGLAKIIPSEMDFGNVKVTINVIPSDKAESMEQVYKTIFNGNPVFSDAVEVDEPGLPHMCYIVFKPEIVQFYDDNLCDLNGNMTTLHQDIAGDVLNVENNVYFCTENIRNDG